MPNLVSVYFVKNLLCVSDVSIAHHLEVQPYVCNNWYLLFLDDSLLSWPGVPPDDGL